MGFLLCNRLWTYILWWCIGPDYWNRATSWEINWGIGITMLCHICWIMMICNWPTTWQRTDFQLQSATSSLCAHIFSDSENWMFIYTDDLTRRFSCLFLCWPLTSSFLFLSRDVFRLAPPKIKRVGEFNIKLFNCLLFGFEPFSDPFLPFLELAGSFLRHYTFALYFVEFMFGRQYQHLFFMAVSPRCSTVCTGL